MNAGLRRIFILVFGDPELLDIAGPDKVFPSAADGLVQLGAADEPLYSVDLFSPDGGLVRTRQDIRVETMPIHDLAPGECDTLIAVGGREAAGRDPGAIDWLRRNHPRVRRISAISVGAFALAEARLLDGRRATTHWRECARFRRIIPRSASIPRRPSWRIAGYGHRPG